MNTINLKWWFLDFTNQFEILFLFSHISNNNNSSNNLKKKKKKERERKRIGELYIETSRACVYRLKRRSSLMMSSRGGLLTVWPSLIHWSRMGTIETFGSPSGEIRR